MILATSEFAVNLVVVYKCIYFSCYLAQLPAIHSAASLFVAGCTVVMLLTFIVIIISIKHNTVAEN